MMNHIFESSNKYSFCEGQSDLGSFQNGNYSKVTFFDVKNESAVLLSENDAGICTASSESVNCEITDINKVARWFLYKESMTQKKLQSVCYYAYCWFIVWFNNLEAASPEHSDSITSICEDSFEAWIHGPVCRSLYSTYKMYGWNPIPKERKRVCFNADVEQLLEQVWEAYGELNASQLETLSHSEAPWQKARKGLEPYEPGTAIINKYDILEYYSKVNS